MYIIFYPGFICIFHLSISKTVQLEYRLYKQFSKQSEPSLLLEQITRDRTYFRVSELYETPANHITQTQHFGNSLWPDVSHIIF